MVMFLSNSFSGSAILSNSKIAFWDRLGFVMRYCTDEVGSTSAVLHFFTLKIDAIFENCRKNTEKTSLEFLILFGKSEVSSKILRLYLDQTNDL